MPPPSSSRYRPDAAPDYSHRFHAGNVGDVWKHCVLVEVLRRIGAPGGPVVYVESHAGEGTYALGPTGEWTEGIGRLLGNAAEAGLHAGAAGGRDGGAADDAVERYVALCRRFGVGAVPARYPGSPRLAAAVLGSSATLRLWERDREAAARLRSALPPAARAEVLSADGLAALPDALAAAAHAARGDGAAAGNAPAVVALVDPPFTQKPDWIAVPEAVIAAAARAPRATILLWYPVKSLTRPNAMLARFKAAGVSATVAELVTTPLEHQRRRLNGSGVVLVRPPAGTLAAIAAAAPTLGTRCATQGAAWSMRMMSW